MARPRFEPTDEHRKLVKLMIAGGIPEADICKVIGPKGISENTLRKYFRPEIETGAIEFAAQLVGRAKQLAFQNDDKRAAAAMTMFLCKVRLGWKETSATEVVGKDGGPIAFEGGMPPITVIVEGVSHGDGGAEA